MVIGTALNTATEGPQAGSAQSSADAALAATRSLLRTAHELKAPASAMLSLAELLADDSASAVDPQRRTETLRHLISAGHHLLALIDDLTHSPTDLAGRPPLHIEPLDLDDLAAQALACMAASAARRGLTPQLQRAGSGRVALGDRRRVHQVLLNLLSNATKYNRLHGLLTVRVGPGARITVTDTGIGMSAQQLAQLFQPGNRLGRELGPIEGSGLGLTLSLDLARQMGGDLTVSSREGGGTSACLFLPAVAQETGPADNVAAAGLPDSAPAPAALPCSPPTWALCIDDNAVHARLLQARLESRGLDWAVRSAISAQDGLALARAARPGLIFLELNLPDCSGLEVLQQLRDDGLTADIPVVVLSASLDDLLWRRARLLGAAACWPKPLDVQRLDALLSQLPMLSAGAGASGG